MERLGALAWLVIVSLVAGAWIIGSMLYPLTIPPPWLVAWRLATLPPRVVASAVAVTLTDTIAGYIIAALLAGGSVALAIASRFTWRIVYELNSLVQSVSVLVWALIFISFFGATSRIPAVLVAAAAAYPILLSSLLASVSELRSRYHDLVASLGLDRVRELVYILLPGSLPAFIAASRSALGVALRISVVAEAFSSAGGIGYMLTEAYSLGDIVSMYAWALLLIILMIVLDKLILARLEEVPRRWMSR